MIRYVVGRAAMIGFFMTYFVDSLTGVGLVDKMGNFLCKTLLFVAVAGVLFVRKNEDLDKLKKLFDETTLYDKQWQAALERCRRTLAVSSTPKTEKPTRFFFSKNSFKLFTGISRIGSWEPISRQLDSAEQRERKR
ncbi:unnamed protein product [Eruca vesicaria subsp. sativa]|uniref:Uncharacterized protein n=1 Tax=Eruca vesicaria subsp. sativa TaxID=29727 RepID=A0ABC8LBZ8_ERUVS|nr:unnamed protein product [Eruca vesicaria subsp. sativa]